MLKETDQTCNLGTRVAPPINSTAYISSTFIPECLRTSFTGVRDFSHKSPQSSSNFSRVMELLKENKSQMSTQIMCNPLHCPYMSINQQLTENMTSICYSSVTSLISKILKLEFECLYVILRHFLFILSQPTLPSTEKLLTINSNSNSSIKKIIR